MFQVGGTDLLVHKYLGPANTGPSTDITQPQQVVPAVTAIQDLLFLENRDRVYDTSVFRLRGHYNVTNLDFDLSQFGLFLTNDVIFVTVHYNNMIDLIGRKLMVGDVFELPHLTDYNPLNDTLPVSLRRFYQITDANYASEGFSQTWYPHLWRIKCEPLVNSQEFQDILNVPTYTDNYMGNYDPAKEYEPGYTVTYGDKVYTPIQHVPPGVLPTDPAYWQEDTSNPTLGSIISTYNKNIEINNAIISEADRLVPQSGYDVNSLYLVPSYIDDVPAPPINLLTSNASNGGPALGSGSIITIKNKLYKNSSTAIKFNSSSGIGGGLRIILGTGVTATNRSDTGSGLVYGDQVLTATVGTTVTGPYGTADNTYATSDQYARFIITSTGAPVRSTLIHLVEWSNDLSVGCGIKATVYSSNGTPQSVFPANTIITAIDPIAKTITVSNPALAKIPSGLNMEVSYTFKGTSTSTMNYMTDCDPRFQFIRRVSPRTFGYTRGYLTGDGNAPNGESCGTGITFPGAPLLGDYFLRTDYLPQRLFRWDGLAWRQISEKVRTGRALAQDSHSQRASFVNNTDRVTIADGQTIPSRQSLSTVVSLKPD